MRDAPSAMHRQLLPVEDQKQNNPAFWIALSTVSLTLLVLFGTIMLLVGMLVYMTNKPDVAELSSAAELAELEASDLRERSLRAIEAGDYDLAVTMAARAAEAAPDLGDLQELLVIVTELRDSRRAEARRGAAPSVAAPQPQRWPDLEFERDPTRRSPLPKPPPLDEASLPEPMTGTVLITSTPKGLRVEIPGVLEGVTPLRKGELPLGTHEASFYRGDAVVHTQELTISPGKIALLDVSLSEVEAPEQVVEPDERPPSPDLKPISFSGPTQIYVYVPSSAKPRVIQERLSASMTETTVSVYGSYRSFSQDLSAKSPHAVIAPSRVLSSLSMRADLQGRDAGGSSTEAYTLLSREELTLGQLEGLTIGTVDIAGRSSSVEFVEDLLQLSSSVSVKRVPSEADLISLLQLEAADAVLLPARAVPSLEANTQLSLSKLAVPSKVGLPAVSVLDEERRALIERVVRALSPEDSAKLGVHSWGG